MSLLAFDKSVRHLDENGILHVDVTNISKSVINPYMGYEIPLHEELGLDPDKVYRLYRDASELEKAVDTFRNLPVLSKHVPVFADKPPKELIIGSTGSDVEFNSPYLSVSLSIWDNAAINLIEADAKKALSSAYLYDADMTAGEINGEQYDGIMRNIRGNHVAVVESGRAGSDVVVADSNPFYKSSFKENDTMRMTKKGKARLTLLKAALPKLAQDAALPALVNGKAIDKAKVRALYLALDDSMDPQQLDNIIDAVLGVEQVEETPEPMTLEASAGDDESAVEESSPHEKLHGFLAEKGLSEDDIETAKGFFPANDAYDSDDNIIDESEESKMEGKPTEDEEVIEETQESKEWGKPAMDAALKAHEAKLTAKFKELELAKADVRSVVGEVLGMDSAEEVYKFALKSKKIAFDGVNELSGLKAVFKASLVAMDAKPHKTFSGKVKSMTDAFPGLKRF